MRQLCCLFLVLYFSLSFSDNHIKSYKDFEESLAKTEGVYYILHESPNFCNILRENSDYVMLQSRFDVGEDITLFWQVVEILDPATKTESFSRLQKELQRQVKKLLNAGYNFSGKYYWTVLCLVKDNWLPMMSGATYFITKDDKKFIDALRNLLEKGDHKEILKNKYVNL